MLRLPGCQCGGDVACAACDGKFRAGVACGVTHELSGSVMLAAAGSRAFGTVWFWKAESYNSAILTFLIKMSE